MHFWLTLYTLELKDDNRDNVITYVAKYWPIFKTVLLTHSHTLCGKSAIIG